MKTGLYGPDAVVSELKRLLEVHGTYRAVAREIGVNHGIIWMACRPKRDRYVSACLYKALGINKSDRVRICADVTESQRQALKELAAREGLTWSEYCRRIADNCLNYEKAFEIHSLDLK